MRTIDKSRYTFQEFVVLIGAYMILIVFCAMVFSAVSSDVWTSRFFADTKSTVLVVCEFLIFIFSGFCIFASIRYTVRLFRNIRVAEESYGKDDSGLSPDKLLACGSGSKKLTSLHVIVTFIVCTCLSLFFLIAFLTSIFPFNVYHLVVSSVALILGVLAFSPILLVAQLRQLGFEAKTSERPADNGKKIHNLFEKCLIALSWLMVFISLFIVISESQFEFYTTSIVIALAVFVYCFLNCFAKAFCSIRHIGAGK